ncbi:MAG: WbqC family protein [Balneolaceae bacterium]|nr:WbqC family protein [Balneolaceae bacterium]
MHLALIQPQFAPNLYDLAAMLRADQVLLQDVETWSRKSRCHRAKIRIVQGTQWINLPIKTEDKGLPVNEVRINHDEDWLEPFQNALNYNYRNSVYYDFYEAEISALLNEAKQFDKLLDFDQFFFDHLLRYLELDIPYKLTSQIEGYDPNPDRLMENLGANVLFQEHKAKNYQRQSPQTLPALTNHPVYRQHFEGFEPGCCVLDLLFQYGPESFRILDELS